jgi:hypothetical protein
MHSSFPGYTDLFISPVTGRLSGFDNLDMGYTYIGGKNGFIPTFKLIDLRIDVNWLQDFRNIISRLPFVLTKSNKNIESFFPNAQVLEYLQGNRRMLRVNLDGELELADPMVDYVLFDEDGNLNIQGGRVINVSDPVNPLDAANKEYVDAHSGGATELTATGEVFGYKAAADTVINLSLSNQISVKNGTMLWVNGDYDFSSFSFGLMGVLENQWDNSLKIGAYNSTSTTTSNFIWFQVLSNSLGVATDLNFRNGGYLTPSSIFLNYNIPNNLLSIYTQLSMNNNKITNLSNPTSSQDAATKSYVDGINVGVTSITAGTGLSANGIGGGTITNSGTLAIRNTGVTSGNYAFPTQVQVDATGRVVTITSGSEHVASISVSGNNLIKTGTTVNPILELNSYITASHLEIANGGDITFNSAAGGVFDGSGATQVLVPAGNTASRFAFPQQGSLRVNTETGNFEYCYDNATWSVAGSGSSSSEINISGSVIGSGTTGTTPVNVSFNKDQYMNVNSASATGYYGFNFIDSAISSTKRIYRNTITAPVTGTGSQNSSIVNVYANGDTAGTVYYNQQSWQETFDLGGSYSLYYAPLTGGPLFLFNTTFNSLTNQLSTTFGGNCTVTGTLKINSNMDANNRNIINLADPVNPQDAVNLRSLTSFAAPRGSFIIKTVGAGLFSLPAGINSFKVTLVGGGGAGAGSVGGMNSGAGGGAGATVIGYFATAGMCSYVVGAGGSGVVNAAGNNGSATTFTYGAITLTAGGGGGGSLGTSTISNGGLGGVASGGSNTGSLTHFVHLNGGGGGAGANIANIPGGHGGNSSLGGGAPGVNSTAQAVDGLAGSPNTGGGGGGTVHNGYGGGAGGSGVIIIDY